LPRIRSVLKTLSRRASLPPCPAVLSPVSLASNPEPQSASARRPMYVLQSPLPSPRPQHFALPFRRPFVFVDQVDLVAHAVGSDLVLPGPALPCRPAPLKVRCPLFRWTGSVLSTSNTKTCLRRTSTRRVSLFQSVLAMANCKRQAC